jgi:hypothetical protein
MKYEVGNIHFKVINICIISILFHSMNTSDLIGGRRTMFRMSRYGIDRRKFSFTIVQLHEENM